MRKNSFKRIFAALALSAVATTSVASISAFAEGDLTPGPQEDGSFNFVQKDGTIATYTADDIAGAATKPTLSASKVTLTESEAKEMVAKGETVTVEVTISGAANKWLSTGIHLFYDERLTPTLNPFGLVDVQKGSASKYIPTLQSKENETDRAGAFVTTAGDGDFGLDGVMFSVAFSLPDDVAAGEVYNLDLDYISGDLFTNHADNLDGRLMQAYTFVNGLDDGYIEIVEDPTDPPVTTTTTAVTTTTTAAATTTTTAKAGTTTTAKPTTTGKATTTTTGKKTDSPKTGVAGVGVAAAGLVVAAGAAFVLRKKED